MQLELKVTLLHHKEATPDGSVEPEVVRSKATLFLSIYQRYILAAKLALHISECSCQLPSYLLTMKLTRWSSKTPSGGHGVPDAEATILGKKAVSGPSAHR